MSIDIGNKYHLYGTMLFKLCLVMLANEADAEDAVQDTFLKYMKRNPGFESDEHEKAWFIRVGTNVCRDMLRARKRRPTVDMDEISELIGEEEPDRLEMLEMLEQILVLPQKIRTVIYLFYVEEYKVKEIARMIRASVSAVKMRLSRGRILLKLEMEENTYEKDRY
jgi:RNA polymerase sigma-70 factor (ECF subfamily)